MPIGGRARQSEESGDGWLTTFGDMVTLLFTFFVLVYSFCSYSPGDWETAAGSIKGALSVIPGSKGNSLMPGGGSGPFPAHMGVVPLLADVGSLEETAASSFDDEIQEVKEQMAGVAGIEIEETPSGVLFRVATPVLFDKGSDAAKPSAQAFLQAIGRATRETPATVIVTGHTCDLPISTAEFQSNWELSARRAATVLRMLEAHAGDRAKFVALARGQHDPLVGNLDEGCRMINRRVEIEIDLTGRLPFE
jgi:chemotaxis protein MotB